MSTPTSALLSAKRDTPIAGIVLSIALHVGLLGMAWWFSRDTEPRIDLSKPIQAKLVRLGEKRDEKLLPRMEPNVPPPAPEPTPVAAKSAPEAVPDKPQPKPKAAAPQKDLTKDLFAAFDKTKPVTRPDKLAGAADGDVRGDADSAEEGERYFGLVTRLVKDKYDVSSAISDAERVRLVAVIVLYVDGTGRVTKTVWQAKSGNDFFDNAVSSAVQKASPFPPPPAGLRDSLSKVGVALRFRP